MKHLYKAKTFLSNGTLCIILLTTCKENQSKEKKITISWQAYAYNKYDEFRKRQGKDFEIANPEVGVNYEPVAGASYDTKLYTKLVSGSAIDVFFVRDFINYVKSDNLLSLDFLVAENKEYFSTINPSLLSSCYVDGKLYGLPGNASVDILWINLDLFEKNGIRVPEKEMTWGETMQLAQKFMIKGQKIKTQWGILFQSDVYELMFLQLGGKYFSDDYKKVTVDSIPMHLAIEDTIRYFSSGCAPTVKELQETGNEEFYSGKIAMYLGRSWEGAILKENASFRYKALRVPYFEGREQRVFVGNNILCINNKSNNPQIAAKFAFHLISENSIKFIVNMGDSLPIRATGDAFDYFNNRLSFYSAESKVALLSSLSNSVSKYTFKDNNPYISQSEIQTIVREEIYPLLLNLDSSEIPSAIKKTSLRIQKAIDLVVNN